MLRAAGALAASLRRTPMDVDAEEKMAMANEAYKAWLDTMPIDDVHHKAERLEHKLSDLRVLERLYAERQPAAPEASDAEAPSEPSEPADDESQPKWGPGPRPT
jgi:hypothetical protein